MAPSAGERNHSVPCCVLVTQCVVQQHRMVCNILWDLPYGTICHNPSVPYRPKHAILTEFAKDFRAVCLWSGLHAQRAFWHCNCGQHGSCGIPIPSEYFPIGFHLKIMKNQSNDSNRDLFHFLGKNVVDGERLLALQSASGLDAVSGRSISSRTDCVAPRIW